MARYLFRRMLRTNTASLRQLQARGGVFDSSNPDIFFQTLPDLVGKPVYWGRQGASANPPMAFTGVFVHGTEE
jgi:hypothetical protein